MTFKLKSLPFAVACAVASGALVGSVPAFAQTTEPAGASAPQRVVVTGSLISRANTETPTPVQVLTAADIQKSGKTSVAELLTDLAANGAGTLGTGFAGAFANGASGISLRGLTVGATLVLIDGHRMTGYPLSDDAQRQFVDVSSIPFDAIETIEVLKSGASSLYGSDAIAGVINIKLKKSLTGTRLTAEYGDTQHGGGKTKRASISSGIGDIDQDGYNAFFTAEIRKQDYIKVADRDSFNYANRDWRSRGGNNITLGAPVAGTTAAGAPRSINSFLTAANSPFLYNPSGAGGVNNAANFVFLDPSKCNYTAYMANQCTVRDTFGFIQPETENVNLLVGMTKKLNDNWELALKGSIFQRESTNNRGATPQVYNPLSFPGVTTLNNGVLVTRVNAINDTTFAPGARVGANVTNPFANNARLYGFIPDIDPNLTTNNKSTTSRISADLTGSAMGWDIQAGAGMTKVKVDAVYSGYINRRNLYNAINNGSWNVLGGNSPELIAAVSPVFNNTLESTLNYVDLVGSREILPSFGAGPLAFAAGYHWHKREQNAPASSLTAIGAVANTSAFTIGDETNQAVFAELRATPIKAVEVSLSSRYDHYDTYGNSFTPAANFKWQPVSNFAIRGTFARGFRAPNPAEVGNAGSFFTFNSINDPILCANGNQNTAGNVPTACGFSPPYVQTTNPDLQPEKSKSYTLGLVYEPMRGLNMTLDYYKIKINNLVVTQAGNDPSFVPTWVRGPALPVDVATGVGDGRVVATPSVGPILYGLSPYINAGAVQTHGIEADVRYRWRLANDMGTLSAALSAAHTFGYESIIGDQTIQLAGTQGPSSVGGATGNPKDRAQFTLGYNRGPLDVTATVNYTSGFSTIDPALGVNDCTATAAEVGGRNYFQGVPGGQPAFYCNVPSFTVTNLNVQYKLSQNLTLRGAILNLFDREAPIDVGTYGNAGAGTSYNASLHQPGAVGRFFSLGLNYTF
ncbi:TonB-dependent receptor [Massilia sp. IC2-476]|uniref:TonB-dependent receptor n=1 Tax=Massilia sp. IC2-476 TaxID=2887199 RepID=UPI001D11E541|nr:TonB-dependent receptor [Massilia sp. IC2-476]MCC2971704.1 TonB-dependent receptor [Massilia sp. IC2-476]